MHFKVSTWFLIFCLYRAYQTFNFFLSRGKCAVMSVFIADLTDHMSENYFCESEVVSLNYMENYTHTHKKAANPSKSENVLHFVLEIFDRVNYESTNQLATLS